MSTTTWHATSTALTIFCIPRTPHASPACGRGTTAHQLGPEFQKRDSQNAGIPKSPKCQNIPPKRSARNQTQHTRRNQAKQVQHAAHTTALELTAPLECAKPPESRSSPSAECRVTESKGRAHSPSTAAPKSATIPHPARALGPRAPLEMQHQGQDYAEDQVRREPKSRPAPEC
jgi:hypothetical protein